MGLRADKRRFLASVIGEEGVEAVERSLMTKSRALEDAGVRWKEERDHPVDSFIALLQRDDRNSRDREPTSGRTPVESFIADMRTLLKRQTPTVKW